MKITSIHLANFMNTDSGERARTKLKAATEHAYWDPNFVLAPYNGSLVLSVETRYDFSIDSDGKPQDPEKEFQSVLLGVCAYLLGVST